MSSLSNKLAEHDDAFESAEDPYGLHPAGVFEAMIVASEIEETDWNTQQWAIQYQTEHGKVWRNHQIDPIESERLGFLKRDLRTLGFEGKLSEFESFISTIIGATVEIRVVHKEGESRTFVNAYLNKLVSPGGGVGREKSREQNTDFDEIGF